MSPRTFVARSAALLSLAALGLAACESKTVVQPQTFPLTIAVSPAAVTLSAVGQKAQFVAVVSGGTSDQVKTYSWASSNNAVATVDANGVVTAVAQGVATITATATADANVKAAGLVTVQLPAPPDTTKVPATVSIQQVTTNAGTNVDLNNVFGQINVALNVDPGQGNNISKVEVLVDGSTACSQSFTQGTSTQVGVDAADAVTIVCSINTAALKADGSPVYPNKASTVSARLVATNGTIVASTSQTFVFNNPNALNLAVTTAKNAIAPNGVVWNGGDITVKVTPAIFGLTGNLTNVTVTVGAAVKSQTPTSNAGVLTFVFPDTMLQRLNVWGQQLVVSANSSVSTGATGPLGTANPMAIDESAPTLTGTGASGGGYNMNGIAAAPFWFGSASAFTPKALGFNPATAGVVVDNGVDNVTLTVQTSPNTTTKTWTDAASDATGASVGESAAASLVLRIHACDALGNCSNTAASPAYGIDVIPPELTGNVVPTQVNPAGAYTFSVADTGTTSNVVSGTPTNNLVVVEKIFTPAKTLCATDAAGTTADMPTSGSNANKCASFGTPDGTGFTVPAAEGYDSVTVFAVDSAGNQSATTMKLFLTDNAAPTISSILPTTLAIAGGSSVTFNALVQDAIDIGSLTGVLTYGAPAVVELALPTQQLGTFGLPLENTQMTAAYTINPFVTSIQATLGAAGTNATALDATLTDAAADKDATLFATHSAAAPQLLLAPFVTDQSAFDFGAAANGGLTSQVLTASAATICVACSGAGTTHVDTLVYKIVQPTNAPTPFTKVTFYRTTGGTQYTPIGSVTPGQVSQTLTDVTITWKLVYTAAKPAASGSYNFIAVGVDSKGHGLMSNAVAVQIDD